MASSLLNETLAGRPGARVPLWLMRQAGRYLPEYQRLRAGVPDFLRFCYTPDVTVEAALQPLRRFPLDAAIVFSDILVIPDALGRDVRFVEGEGPVLTPLRRAEEIDALVPDRIEAHLAPLARSVLLLKQALPAETALIGFAGAPWTLAHYMVEGRGGSDGATARQWAYRSPADVDRLIDVLTDAVIRTLALQIDAGATVVQLFDSWAGGLAEGLFRRLVIRPTQAIVGVLHARYPGVPVIGFPRSAGLLYEAYVAETGVDAVSLDAAVPAACARDRLQPRCPVQGNLDNRLLVAGGPALAAEATRLLETLAGGAHVFNLGHGVLPETPVAHVEALAALVHAWRRGW